MLNSDRKKISLTGRVIYLGGEQDVYLCLMEKQNTADMRCGIPERSVTATIAWASEKLHNHWRFSTSGGNEERKNRPKSR